MGKFKPEEVMALLSKEVSTVLASDDNKGDDKIAAAIANLEKKMSGILEFVSKNVQIEKPKTVEEHLTEFRTSMLDEIKKMMTPAPAAGAAAATEKKIGEMTEKEFDDKVTATIAKAMDKVVKTAKPKGKSVDETAIEDLVGALADSNGVARDEVFGKSSDEDDEEPEAAKPLAKDTTVIDTVESVNSRGEDISLEKRQKMQSLDDYIGGVLSTVKK